MRHGIQLQDNQHKPVISYLAVVSFKDNGAVSMAPRRFNLIWHGSISLIRHLPRKMWFVNVRLIGCIPNSLIHIISIQVYRRRCIEKHIINHCYQITYIEVITSRTNEGLCTCPMMDQMRSFQISFLQRSCPYDHII